MSSLEQREREIRTRLGKTAVGAKRDIRGVAALIEGEELRAVVVVLWRRRGWVAAATDAGLRLAWRSAILGRPANVCFQWAELTDVSVTRHGVKLAFGEQVLSLWLAGPSDEFARLLDCAREFLGQAVASVSELRELAQRKLGRLLAFGREADYAKLPELLEADERVERMALAKLDFDGLLVLTDRRLLLVDVGSQDEPRLWSADRERILTAEAMEGDLRLSTADGEVTLTNVLPPERLDEFRVAAPRPAAP